MQNKLVLAFIWIRHQYSTKKCMPCIYCCFTVVCCSLHYIKYLRNGLRIFPNYLPDVHHFYVLIDKILSSTRCSVQICKTKVNAQFGIVERSSTRNSLLSLITTHFCWLIFLVALAKYIFLFHKNVIYPTI